MPSPHRAMVLRAVERDFPFEDLTVVMEILDLYGIESHERERDRVQLAILKLSSGDVDTLLHFVRAAKRDYRDVLWWSDMPPLSKTSIE